MKNRFDYHGEYNELLSNVASEFGDSFAAMASPTLSKQETVTFLFEFIKKAVKSGAPPPNFPWYLFLVFFPRLILIFLKFLYASLRFRVTRLPEGAIYFRTWLVPRSISDAGIVDDYFRELPKDLSLDNKVIIGYSVLKFGTLKKFARHPKSNDQIISYGLLSIADVFKLFAEYVTSALIQAKKSYTLEGLEVTKFINQSLLIDYLALRSFGAYVEKYLCNKLATHKIKAFVYVFENQAWEKAVCSILRPMGVTLIGYQSSGFSPVFLNFFPTKTDSLQQPMPDILLTVGEYFRRYLIKHGHFRMPVVTFAALRFSYPKLNNSYIVSQPNERILQKVLYAFPVHLDQYSGIINDMIAVFANSEIGVDLKFHPLYSLDDVDCINNLPSNFKVVSNVDMTSLNETYDCVLFNDNSFGIEALLMGVKSYQYSRDGSFIDDRLMYFDLWQVNYRLGDVYKLRDAIESFDYQKKFDANAVAAYINAMYCPYGPDALCQFDEILTRLTLND
jgi:hypothetical protein